MVAGTVTGDWKSGWWARSGGYKTVDSAVGTDNKRLGGTNPHRGFFTVTRVYPAPSSRAFQGRSRNNVLPSRGRSIAFTGLYFPCLTAVRASGQLTPAGRACWRLPQKAQPRRSRPLQPPQ